MDSAQNKPKWKVGETLCLQVEGLSPQGRGVAVVDGRTLFVKESLPGDQVEVRLTRIRPGQAEAKLLKIESAASERVVPRCPHFGPCGGCDFQHLDYKAQVEFKIQALCSILRQEAGIDPLPFMEVYPMRDPWAYRSKMEFSFGQEDQRVTLGLHQRASFQRIVDIHTCFIAPADVSELLRAIKEVANRFPLRSYNPRIHQGFWRYAVIRSSLSSGDLMLLVVTNEGPQEPIQALKENLPKEVPSLKSFYWGVSTRVSDVAVPERMSLVFGSEVLEDQVGAIRFQIRPTNFVQPNLPLAAQIYEGIRFMAPPGGWEAVYDLYCGIGLIALSLADKAKIIYGVESDEENVESAQRNAALNGITNTVFLKGKVEDLLKGRSLFKLGLRPDLIVVDPPRAGLHKDVYAPLLQAHAPSLLYLSCNPMSLARDLKILLERDPRYRVKGIQLFDFFPHTTHVEIMVTLSRC